MTLNISWAFSEIILSGLIYLIKDWRVFYGIFIVAPALLLNIMNWRYVLESARFYFD